MPLTKKEFAHYIRAFEFRELFNDLGWNNDKTSQPIIVDNETFMLRSVAVKSGFKILVCSPNANGQIPDYNIRKRIENKITKLFQEHLIIFTDTKEKEQVWQLVMKQTGKPAKVTDTRYALHQDPELLYQRVSGLFFELDEEENITIVDVTKRVSDNFHQNAEKVTKHFYEKFKKEHVSFYAFITGIDDQIDDWNKKRKKGDAEQDNKAKQWYVSLMLNRLMFCYFIQKKGFLDKNQNYLRDKLKDCKQKKGKDKFYSFYRDFLLVLFHEGLNEPTQKEEIKIEIGKIPYLNGGLFDEHELEKEHKAIEIDDKAFERIFDFFDEYEWHLDTRQQSTGKEINPDVIGYIFEKYINDRAQMGAYYTKEDITDYISKNCIIPWLFDETARQYPKAFTATGEIWNELKESGDTYIYPAVKLGNDQPLPRNISEGIKDVDKRTDWNKAAPENMALPTEIWREVVERRKRYGEVAGKIKARAISHINDFITYNLNIREFAQDVIANTNDADLLKCFYKSLCKVTIIDPTCGSGAFLFAAMNILEPLYYACIIRMWGFTEDEDRANEQQPKKLSNKYKFFREVLEQVQSEHHPNTEYFIYKSIILNNLYGVDIMREAVEIAKLRLFLKLVATVDADFRKPNLGLEPLPDIDFNIRSGNTLIGFANEDELKKGLRYTLDGVAAAPVIEERCDIVAKAFARYKEIQLSYGDDFKEFKKAKAELSKRLKELNKELNKLLHKQAEGIKYDVWLETHQPFHWFAEFYEIIHDKKGFDVIIGNPPYVEYKDVKNFYTVKNYLSFDAGDLYAFIMERSLRISHSSSRIGFIIPMSCFTVDGFSTIQNLYYKNSESLYISNWSGDAHPAKLFEGVDKRLHIVLSIKAINNQLNDCKTYVTKYIKWYSEERNNLFDTKTNYFKLDRTVLPFFKSSLPKVSSEIERKIIEKIKRGTPVAKVQSNRANKHSFYYTRKVSFFLQFLDFVPIVKDDNGSIREPSELKSLSLLSDHLKYVSLASLSSNLFYWYYIVNSDCRNLNKREVLSFFLPQVDEKYSSDFKKIVKALMVDYERNSLLRTVFYKDKGNITVQYFNFRLSKVIIDKIDLLLSKFYDLAPEELDFVTNYEIKYRMGKEIDNED